MTCLTIARCVARGSCKPVIIPVTARSGRSGVITRSVQPSPDGCGTPAVGHGLERAHDRGADGDDAATRPSGGVDPVGRVGRARGRTLHRAARDPRGWRRRCGAAAARSQSPRETSRVTSSGVNGRAGRRHLRAARLGREHGLIHRCRPRVAARSRSESGSPTRSRYATSRLAEAARAAIHNRDASLRPSNQRVRREQRDVRAAGSANVVPARAWRYGSDAAGPGRRTSTVQKPPGSRVDRCSSNASPCFVGCGQRRVHRAAGVDDEQIAWREPSRQVAESRVLDRVAVDARHEQPHLVAAAGRALPAVRRLRAMSAGERSITPAAAIVHPPAAPRTARRGSSAGSWSNSQFQNGDVTSGSGRSEMSVAGNASWCMRVRMSPGSTSTADTPSA